MDDVDDLAVAAVRGGVRCGVRHCPTENFILGRGTEGSGDYLGRTVTVRPDRTTISMHKYITENRAGAGASAALFVVVRMVCVWCLVLYACMHGVFVCACALIGSFFVRLCAC